MIHIINRKSGDENRVLDNVPCIYIGRGRGGIPGNFGNPFSIGRDGTREEVIEKFRVYFKERLQNNIAVRAAFNGLVYHASVGDLYLVCWCAPLACHGDVIRELILAEIALKTGE